MRIDFPTPEDIPGLRRLWQEAFGDDDAFLDVFFSTAYSPRRCRCIRADGSIAAMLFWFDCRVGQEKLAYLYAVATAESHRGRGLCHALMEDTHRHLAALDYQGAILVPGSEELFRLYAGMGYENATTALEFDAPAGSPIPLEPLTKAEYARRRAQLLPPGSVIQDGENLDFLAGFASFYGSGTLLWAATVEGDSLHVMELLGDPAAAPGIVAAQGAAAGHFRTPGGKKPFAMYRSLGEYGTVPQYFGLAFD